MTRWFLGVLLCHAVLGCSPRDGGPAVALAPRERGVRLTKVGLTEEREGKVTLRLKSESGGAPSLASDLSLRKVDVRFGASDEGFEAVRLQADAALLERAREQVVFTGKVRAEDPEKRTFAAEKAVYSLKQRLLEIPVPLVTDSEQETVSAARAKFDFNEETVVLEGRVRAVVKGVAP